MKYYIIAGEASGDLHGSKLVTALQKHQPEVHIRAWGGDLMEAAGAKIVKHYRDLAFMGFVEVAKNIRTILGNIRFCKEDILAFEPDALILIDYPGFNLRIAKWAKKQGLKVYYYISPQVWAWNSKRVHGIKASVDRLFVILPFEKDFYAKYDMEVDFVGHPLMDIIPSYPKNPDFRAKSGLNNRDIIALLPGSRRQEIRKMLAIMLSVAPQFPAYQFVIAGAPSIPVSFYEEIIAQQPVAKDAVHIVSNQTYDLLSEAKAALVTSGTATLETALFEVPQVVCYKGNAISYLIARQVIRVPYIALVNLIVNKPLIKELIQHQLTQESLTNALIDLLDSSYRKNIKNGYEELKEKLGAAGASERVAGLITNY